MDELLKVVDNRYEAVIVASREARRLNNLQRLSGSDQKTKVTVSALSRLLKGDIKWEYGPAESLKAAQKLKPEEILRAELEEKTDKSEEKE